MLCSATWFVTFKPARAPGVSDTTASCPATLLFTILIGGENPIMCGVLDVHLEDFVKAAPNEHVECSDGLPSVPLSMTSSSNINTLRPRRRARAPVSFPFGKGFLCCFDDPATICESSDEPAAASADEDRGEGVCVLATELVLLFGAGKRRPRSNPPPGDCDEAASPEEEPGDVDRVLAAELLLFLGGFRAPSNAAAGDAVV